MIDIVITGVIARNSFGVICSANNKTESYLRVIFPATIFPSVGDVYEINGESEPYKDKYGRKCTQIKATIANRKRTSGRLIRPWLETIPGLGSTRSSRLMDAFGEKILEYIKNPRMTDEIARAIDPNGTVLGEKLAAQVQAKYIAQQVSEDIAIAEADFLLELEKNGVTDQRAAKKMFRLIGSTDAFGQLIKNPYLTSGLIRWTEADHLGKNLLSKQGVANPQKHPERLAGACDAVWRDFLSQGHTAATLEAFHKALKNKRVAAHEAVKVGLSKRRIIKSGEVLRAPGAAYLECSTADRLLKIINSPSRFSLPDNLVEVIRSCENPKRLLTGEQFNVVYNILQHSFSILQGGAGTGKTTTLRVVVAAWEKLGGNVILGALSGKAALRLSRSTGKLAQTLARHLIRFEKNSIEFKNVINKGLFPEITNKTLFICDEASMVDLATMYKLLGYLEEGARLCLVGDVSQLPPVGIGQVYHDLVSADLNVFRLTTALRQKNEQGTDITNPIIDISNNIRDGKPPVLPSYEGIDTGAFLLQTNDTEVDATVAKLLRDLIKQGIPVREILVLASLKGTCNKINHSMSTEKQMKDVEGIRVSTQAPFVTAGDPVVCTRNRYDTGLMNGQIGYLNTLDPFTINWDGEESCLVVDPSMYFDIASAWALTCHRAQGSENRFVIVALDSEFMLTREWLYTATTRASQQVIFVGSNTLIPKGITKRATRCTYFVEEFKLRRTLYEDSGN